MFGVGVLRRLPAIWSNLSQIRVHTANIDNVVENDIMFEIASDSGLQLFIR